GHMGEDITDVDLTRGITRRVAPLDAARVYLQVLELGDVLGDRVLQLEGVFFVQHHQSHAGDGLRHGVDAEDRVVLQGFAGFHVHAAVGVVQHHLAVTADDDCGSRYLPLVNVTVHRAC